VGETHREGIQGLACHHYVIVISALVAFRRRKTALNAPFSTILIILIASLLWSLAILFDASTYGCLSTGASTTSEYVLTSLHQLSVPSRDAAVVRQYLSCLDAALEFEVHICQFSDVADP